MDQIRFHFDPMCPWCYQTSRWARRLEELGEVEIDWRVFSLGIANMPEGGDPYALETPSAAILRTVKLLDDGKAAGRFYAALGQRIWETETPVAADDLDAIRDSLTEAGLGASLVDKALADDSTWTAVVDEHLALVERTQSFGVPTIAIDGDDGPAIFGPVLATLPNDDDAVELWHHVRWLMRYGNFAELKRGRPQMVELPALPWHMERIRAMREAAANSS